jgi:hypothetical protein
MAQHFERFPVPMPPTNLEEGDGQSEKSHQIGLLGRDAPSGIVGVDDFGTVQLLP